LLAANLNNNGKYMATAPPWAPPNF
jgi:hypothetical protein